MIRVMIPKESVRDLGNKQLASDAVLSIFFDKAAPGLPTITVFGGPEADQPINIDRDGDGTPDTDVAGGVFSTRVLDLSPLHMTGKMKKCLSLLLPQM